MKELIDNLQQELLMLINKQMFILQDLKATDNLWSTETDSKKLFTIDSINEKLSVLANEREKTTRLEAVVAIVGTMKAGKSTTINAIVGEDILPNRNNPMTTIPTLIRHAPNRKEPILTFNSQPVLDLISSIKNTAFNSDALNLDEENKSILIKIQNDTIKVEEKYIGKQAIQDALKDINDIFRLAKTIGVNNVNDYIKQYTDYINLPVIEIAFTHSPHQITGGVLSLLDTPGPNEAGQDEVLRTCLNEQLKRASITLCVMDYTQLKSEAEAQVRKQIADLKEIFDNKLFVVVNKFDQSNKNAMDAQEVKEYAARLISQSLEGEFDESKIFPVAAFPALLATQVERLTQTEDFLPALMQAKWLDDFGKRAFGTEWEDILEDGVESVSIKRLNKASERMFRNSLFPSFIENIVNHSFSKAVVTSLDSANSKLYDNYTKLQEFLEIYTVGLSQTKAKLLETLLATENAYQRILKSDDKIKDITNHELTNYDEKIKELINIFKQDALQKFNIMFSLQSEALKAQEAQKRHELEQKLKEADHEKWFGFSINRKKYREELYAKAQLEEMKSFFYSEVLDFGQKREEAVQFTHILNAKIAEVIDAFNQEVLQHLQSCNQQTRLSLTKIFNETIHQVSDELRRKLKDDGYSFEDTVIPEFDFSLSSSVLEETNNTLYTIDSRREETYKIKKAKIRREGLFHDVMKSIFGRFRDDYETVERLELFLEETFSISKKKCQTNAIRQLESVCQLWMDNARQHFEEELQPIIDEQYKTIGNAVKSLQLEFEDTLKRSQQDAKIKDKLINDLQLIRTQNTLMRLRLTVVRSGLKDLQEYK